MRTDPKNFTPPKSGAEPYLSWEILSDPPGRLMNPRAVWSLSIDGLPMERLEWNPDRSQYCDAARIARGGSWAEAKSFCEARARKAGKP